LYGWIGGEIPWSLLEYLLDAFGGSIKYFVDDDVLQILMLSHIVGVYLDKRY
jgi:hypothetical protein